MTILRILPRISMFVTLAVFVCVAPSHPAAQMNKNDGAQQIAVQWVNALMIKDDDVVGRITRLPLSFDDMAPLTGTAEVSSAFTAAFARMVRPNVEERVGLRPGAPLTVLEFFTDKKGPPDDQMLKNMSVSREDIAVPLQVVQGKEQIGTLLIVVRDSKVARIFTAAKKN